MSGDGNVTDGRDPEADAHWVLALYGATMLAVQSLENMVSWLYLLTNALRSGPTTGSFRRQWRKGFERSWHAFQHGTARAKLNDKTHGIEGYLDPGLYNELDRFLSGPRAQLVHRFLVERLRALPATEADPARRVKFREGTVHELLQVGLHAKNLTERLWMRAEEIRASIPEAPEVPSEVREAIEQMARMAMLKEYTAPTNPPPSQGE